MGVARTYQCGEQMNNGVEERVEQGFIGRHIGPRESEFGEMLSCVGCDSFSQLIDRALPESIRFQEEFTLRSFATAQSETSVLAYAKELAERNTLWRTYIGMGYYGTVVPPVIQRNILENPGWYTQYTPYQPEISQGRLEALLNFQTLVCDLTGFEIANASLLDEATAAAEAMSLSYGVHSKKSKGTATKFFVSENCHPQTIDVIRTRAGALQLEVLVANEESFSPDETFFGALLQYPNTWGALGDPKSVISSLKEKGLMVTVAADPLALVLLTSPAELGADIAIGSMQRFGVPMGYGGPHAAYFATREEYKRVIPGRLVGVSQDTSGNAALRLALQTREQHIRREKATSNICTSQVLLAIMAGMYATYHGPKGLRQVASHIRTLAEQFAGALSKAGFVLKNATCFDTVTVVLDGPKREEIVARAKNAQVNLRISDPQSLGVSFDETCDSSDLLLLFEIFTGDKTFLAQSDVAQENRALDRQDEILTSEVFHQYHSETEFLRYIKRLESRDLSLAQSMIPLGSCTMKLNATAEMIPIGYEGFSSLHPFVPQEQAKGYQQLCRELEDALSEMTGFDAVSLQPNAGSQGEYAGLLAIKRYHEAQGNGERNICLIPKSAHGTNPASAVMAGMKVVVVACDDSGNIDVEDLQKKAEQHKESLSALMVTYPSTHGVFEERICEICEVIHNFGGQVYLDGANLNALVGLSRPGQFGADVCHMNLHKTFCIPHGGGGPGVGPIGVRDHLKPFLPGHSLVEISEQHSDQGAVSAAPWGSASILPISWAYIALMGAGGLKHATEVAILNANYIAKRLEDHFSILYRGKNNFVAHECIVDFREFKKSAGIEVADIAKRLIDYGFHSPTMSWPVIGTLMIEPTESESKAELDRFCDAMIAIREEIRMIEDGKWSQDDNPLKHAPHTAKVIAAAEWSHPYTREQAVYPSPSTKEAKFWPAVGRIDDSYGDKNLVCTCPTLEDYE